MLCGLAIGPAQAETEPSCPASFPTPTPATKDELRAEADRLSSLLDVCSDRADYFAHEGVVLLMLRQPQKAADALEKALMLNPDLAGTQLDYAQALAELGELDSARRLALDVSRRPDTPFALQAWLSDRLRELGQTPWRIEWTAQWLAGKESNLNSAPTIQSLTLTLPGGDVSVALASSERRLSGNTQRMDLTAFASRSVGDGLFLLSGEASARKSAGNAESDQRVLGGNTVYLHPFLDGQVGLRLNGAQLAVGAQNAYVSRGQGLLFLLPKAFSPAGCNAGVSLDHERRRFPVSPILDGTYDGNQAWANCQYVDWQFNLGLQAGVDRPDHPERLGGDQSRLDFVVGASVRWGGGILSVSGQRGRLRDREIYSTLLGGTPRAVDRLGARVTYEYPLWKGLSAIGYYEKTSQSSNISLFDIQNNAMYVGFKYRGL